MSRVAPYIEILPLIKSAPTLLLTNETVEGSKVNVGFWEQFGVLVNSYGSVTIEEVMPISTVVNATGEVLKLSDKTLQEIITVKFSESGATSG